MVKQENNAKSTLEQRTSLLGRMVAPIVAPIALAAATGCNAPGFYEPTPDARQRHTRLLEFELGAPVKDVAEEVLSPKQLAIESIEDLEKYETPQALIDLVDATFKPSSIEAKAFSALGEQNKILQQLFTAAKVKRVILKDLKSNVDYEGFQIAPLSKADAAKTAELLDDMETYLKALTVEGRQALDAVLGENAEYQGARSFNQTLLGMLYKLSVVTGKVRHHEFQLPEIDQANKYASLIHRSLTGIDRYAEGRKILEKLFEEKVQDILDPQSPAGQEYSDPSMTIRQVYDSIMGKVYAEAQSPGRKTRHNVSLLYGLAKEIVDGAHRSKRLVTQEELDGLPEEGAEEAAEAMRNERAVQVKNVIAAEIADKFLEGLPESEGLGIGYKILSLFPIAGPIILIDNIRPAVSWDDYEPKSKDQRAALIETIVGGNGQDYGARGYNWKGRTAPFIVDSVFAGVGTAGTVASIVGGGWAIYEASKPEPRPAAQAPAPGQPPSGGKGGTSGGITN